MARIKLTRKQMIVMGVVIALLAIVSGVVVWKGFPSAFYGQKDESAERVSVEDVQATALEYANKNDVDGGLKYYDEQISQTENDDDKKSLLLAKSNFAMGAERPDEAVSAAEQANEISPDIASTETLARSYAASGNKEQAIVYYKKVLDLATKEDGSGRYIPIWEEKIAELEQ